MSENHDCTKVPFNADCFECCCFKILKAASVEEMQLILGMHKDLSKKIFGIYQEHEINSTEDLKTYLDLAEFFEMRLVFKRLNSYQAQYFGKKINERKAIIENIQKVMSGEARLLDKKRRKNQRNQAAMASSKGNAANKEVMLQQVLASVSLNQVKRKIIPVYLLIAVVFIPIFVVYFAMNLKPEVVIAQDKPCDVYNSLTNSRIQNYEFARPLLYYEISMEDVRMAALKHKLEQFLKEKKQGNEVIVASVYIKKGGGWITLNKNEEYFASDMQNVPLMITYLKQAEENPAILDKKLYFDRHIAANENANNTDFLLKEHNYYTIQELLHYMIAYSDDDAENLLELNKDDSIFRQLYVDLNLPVPSNEKRNYKIAVENYSKFYRILINATYLSNEMSELGLKMLTECNYRDGIAKNLTDEVNVAHQFGKKDTKVMKELHEFAIVYRGREAYIIGIMTRGKDIAKLSHVINGISNIVYKDNTLESSNGYQPVNSIALAR